MTDDPLETAIYLALTGSHRHLAQSAGKAVRYIADVAPFAALAEPSVEALHDLASMMSSGETVFVPSADPLPLQSTGLAWAGVVPCFQMAYPEEASLPSAKPAALAHIEPLTCANANEMLELIAIAFPGYFRRRTCEMGAYFGIRENGKLVAMGGERMIAGRWREISGLCTHPEHRGRGYGKALMVRLMQQHRAAGSHTWLHVVTDNPAVPLYEAMGFQRVREVHLHRLTREG